MATSDRPPHDRRYGTRRWRRVRDRVLARDNFVCRIAVGCTDPATVADHIIPSFLGMTDALFFDPANLRAGCRHHNIARGVAARLERETAAPAPAGAVVTRDYTRQVDGRSA